jgi:high-affinity Fe2+/Pb2+ permease
MANKRKKGDPSGLAIPSGLFIGMGVGFLLGNFVAWMFLGLGLGFLIMLISTHKRKR